MLALPRPVLMVSILLIAGLLAVPAPAPAQTSQTLFAAFAPAPTTRPGSAVTVTGTLGQGDLADLGADPVATSLPLVVHLDRPGQPPLSLGTVVPDPDARFSVTIPAEASAGRPIGTERSGYRETWALRATTTDGRPVAGAGAVTFAQEAGVQVAFDFTSSVGWVKPGEEFPARVIVSNFDGTAVEGLSVTIPAVDGRIVAGATASNGTATVAPDGGIVWEGLSIAAADDAGPGRVVLVVQAAAADFDVDPEIVWKDLSATAMLPSGVSARSHGPKVIPVDERYDTARYGDRPFPIVPVDFRDFHHLPANESGRLDEIVNSPDFPGSTFNLFQEMSYGQLFPGGVVPSAGVETADFTYEGTNGEGVGFHAAIVPPPNTCPGGTHTPDQAGTPLYPERITDGWYQLPGDQKYYGSDSGGSNLAPALGVPVPANIDNGCGDTGKVVFDAAAIADPEIDYNDFDTDKDGVVDFFMMIFVGCGGNGVSQLGTVPGNPALNAECNNFPGGVNQPYDNIWPHSSTLESGFRDADTGLLGYISDDRLTDLEGNELFYSDASRTVLTTETTEFPAYVRVGPYNVNPETVFDSASVISHEYGHSLGLPDFYNVTDGLDLYGAWNLMAEDFSQNIDVFGRQELGWVVPVEIPAGTSTVEMVGSKTDINRIDWVTPDGVTYTLEGEDVANGQMLRAGLPSRILIDPALVENGASPSHVYWSTSGNDYACPPSANARGLDLRLQQLADLAPDTPVELSFASLWKIEWDFDYGYVLVSTDNGQSYTSLESLEGYSTPAAQNPNANVCHTTYGNGLTGTTASYQAGTSELDRVLGEYPENTGFVTDRYDLTPFAGMDNVVLRFAYVTDVGLAELGWFIDDITVAAGEDVLYSNDLEAGQGDPLLFNGGCQSDSGLGTAPVCSNGFTYVSATEGSPADHAYYLELRDRSGFDLDGRGQSDRGNGLSWTPGLSLGYTDEAYSYGNFAVSNHPGQHVLDAVPEPESDSPDLDDAGFNAGESFSDSGDGHVDNFSDPSREDGLWRFDFNCLTFNVLDMVGDTVESDADGVGTAPREDDLTATVEVTRGEGCVAPRQLAPAQVSLEVERLAGPGRIETAVAVSQRAFADGATIAIIAQAGDFPDALAAAPLAAALNAPLLLTNTGSLAPEVRTELERLGVTQVILLGGENALSVDVEQALSGYEVTRIAGDGRVATAADVARRLAGDTMRPGAIVVRADAFPDALSASNLAIALGIPILLTSSSGLDDAAATALSDTVEAGSVVYLAGGEAALSQQVAADITAAGFTPKRLAGPDRYATSVEITEEALSINSVRFSTAMLASGTNFPDALSAGPAASRLGGLLVLVDPSSLSSSPASQQLLTDNASSIGRLFIAGGTAAVAEDVATAAVAALSDVEDVESAPPAEEAPAEEGSAPSSG